ncbi:hypothetical protein [Pantoea sp. 18069]|uniref:hypothetical protein n=1 Tax=Pantoea sp. 18069 TaxID=2681415 RepID=UPI00135C0130|nr:hypothetical protein [Pantoea sp. 18069]
MSQTGQIAAETIACIFRDVLTGDGAKGLNKSWSIQELMTKYQADADIMKSFWRRK